METLLVLTDFSEEAEHAALYATVLAKQLKSNTIVLYHSYQLAIVLSEGAIVLTEKDPILEESLRQLSELESLIREKTGPGITTRYRADTTALSEINTVAEQESTSMIVMGTKGKTKLEEVILGSAAITICKNSDYPVMLVPVQAALQPVEHITFACDLKEVEKTIPEIRIKKALSDFKVPLAVVNVSDENEYFSEETRANSLILHDMLKGYTPLYYNSNASNVLKGIVEFAQKYTAAIILLVAKKHNFMEGLFHKSLTRQLAYNTPFPLLILRENEF